MLETMRVPVIQHTFVIPSGDHRVVLLGIAVPQQNWQKIRGRRVCGIEMLERAHDVRLAQAAVADGDREQFFWIEQRTCHGEMFALPQGPCRCQQTGNRA